MSRPFICCIKKDAVEFIRKKRSLLCSGILLVLSCMVLLMTRCLPPLLETLAGRATDTVLHTEDISQLMDKLFPQELSGSMGILSADIGVFYSAAIILMCCRVIPDEIRSGCWVLPLGAGYQRTHLLFSKALVYSIGTAVPVAVFYNAYYICASLFLSGDYTRPSAFVNSLVLGFAVFSIANLTIVSSALCKSSTLVAATALAIVVAAPDLLTYVPFGKLFPTYLLTHVYISSGHLAALSAPLSITVLLQAGVYALAAKRLRTQGRLDTVCKSLRRKQR